MLLHKIINRLCWSLGAAFCVFVPFFIANTIFFKRYGYFYRVVPTGCIAHIRPEFELKGEAKELVIGCHAEDPQDILKKLSMICFDAKGALLESDDVGLLYGHLKSGGSLTCAGMAYLYAYIVRQRGFKARIVSLSKNFGERYDSHTTVELLLKDRWVIFDPTFCMSFSKKGELLGVQTIFYSLYNGLYKEIQPIFYNEIGEKRLKNYYIDWLSLFNNVSLFLPSCGLHSSFLLRNTLFFLQKFYKGPALYYLVYRDHINQWLALLEWLYFTTIVIIPVCMFIIMIFFSLFILWRAFLFHKEKRHKTD